MFGVERPRKRRRKELDLEHEWHPDSNADADLGNIVPASKLCELWLGLYGLAKLQQIGFYLICDYCALVGLMG